MQAILLLGGKGTRISRLFPDRPKALVPVAGQPFLRRQLDWLALAGVTDIHLACGHLAEAILEWVREEELRDQRSEVRGHGKASEEKSNGSYARVFQLRIGASMLSSSSSAIAVTCSTEPSLLGTGGGLKYVEPHVRSDPFLVLNGDTLLPGLVLADLELAHRQARAMASIVVTRIVETGRFGTIEFDGNNSVLAFHEKAKRAEGWVNGGVYLLDKKALALIEPGKALSLETHFFPRLAAQGRLRAFPVPPPLLDMGTPEGLAAMESYFKIGRFA